MTANDSELVPTGAYPGLLEDGVRHRAMAALRSSETLLKANRVIAMRTAELRDAVLSLVGQLEDAMRQRDWTAMHETTHEIRGMAGTVGLSATGSIASCLYRYLEAVAQLGAVPDTSVARLHIDAVSRSARTEDDAALYGDAVVKELSALVEFKLSEIKDSARV